MSNIPLQQIIVVAQFVMRTLLWPSIEDPIDTVVLTHAVVVHHGVVFHDSDIVSLVSQSHAPVSAELPLQCCASQPMESHIHCLGLLGLYYC